MKLKQLMDAVLQVVLLVTDMVIKS